MPIQVRGLKAALNSNGKYAFKAPDSVVDYLVVGGGVVGLAIARRLSECFPEQSTYLVERRGRVGEETSSRNSEVIHGGMYYPPDSMKARLCLRGRHMLYDYCAQSNVPYKKTGKLVIAQGHQRAYIESLHEKAKKLQWPPHSSAGKPDSPVAPTFLISGDEARDMEPDLSKDIVAALYSPETGIVDSHSLMESLHKDISDSENGNAAVVLSTKVVRIDPYAPSTQVTGSIDMPGVEEGWVVQTVTGESDESDTLLARHVINTSGLSANLMLNSLLPLEDRIAMYFARGSYASYRGPGVSNISRLLYPVPDDSSKEGHSFQSLGTHLTIDMEGNIKFGPDLEWLDAPKSDEANSDFWERHLVPNDQRIADMHREVTRYLPGVQLEGMQPDYAGIRPKLVAPPHGKFHDFAFRTDYPSTFLKTLTKKERAAPMITLLGIESPGLTSSLAIAELVVDDMLQGGRK